MTLRISKPRRRTLRPAALAALAALLLVLGCGETAVRADIYRVQRGIWGAYRAHQAALLESSRPDSTKLLALRAEFVQAVDDASKRLDSMGKGNDRTPEERRLLRVASLAEVEAARLAMEAGRPDLALERCQALVLRAEGDTTVTRKADILIAGALMRLGRREDAIDAMKAMMVRYPPRLQNPPDLEDFVLGLPTRIIEMRREAGDVVGVRREQGAAELYYNGLILGGGLDPRVEAQVRTRYVRTLVEQGKTVEVFASLDALESQVSRSPELASLIPEVRYTRAKLRSMTDKDSPEVIRALERIAFDFPNSPAAALGLFDAAMIHERAGRLVDARNGYRALVARYPSVYDVASSSILRQALIEDRMGNWAEAKSLFESIPGLYPRSTAAAQAPISVAEHYARQGDTAGLKSAMERAVSTFSRMVATDSLAASAPLLRWNLFRCQAQLGLHEDAFRTADAIVAQDRASAHAAQALLEAAKLAEKNKLMDRALLYWNRYLEAFPDAPMAKDVKEHLRKLSGQK
jgi:tetratricopeptide (TPR) repeat protein